jgi:hypothetical protein
MSSSNWIYKQKSHICWHKIDPQKCHILQSPNAWDIFVDGEVFALLPKFTKVYELCASWSPDFHRQTYCHPNSQLIIGEVLFSWLISTNHMLKRKFVMLWGRLTWYFVDLWTNHSQLQFVEDWIPKFTKVYDLPISTYIISKFLQAV